MILLGIESSCDETAAAVVIDGAVKANAIYSQIAKHAPYGGVVPEIASRDHVRKLLPLLEACLADAGVGRDEIDGVAYTAGPGLIGALLVGSAAGRAIAMALGCPAIARLAEEGDPDRFRFPRPMTDRPGLEFSFSGLKTHTRNLWLENGGDESGDDRLRADIAAGFQQAVIDTMVIKCRRAMQQTGSGQLIVAGGVGANRGLRAALKKAGEKYGFRVSYPRLEFCTDNGAMIAFAGCQRLLAGANEDLVIRARARWSLESLQPPGQNNGVPA